MVDRNAAVPLYYQIYLQLRDEILGGQRPYGSSLPTEHELADLFGVSRITARRVLTELAAQHYVTRRRRHGTKVAFRSPVAPITANIDQAMEALMGLGSRTTVNVVDVGTEAPSPIVASALRLVEDEGVVRAVRVRHLGGEPIGHVVSYVPAALDSVVTAETLAQRPILRLLADAGHKAVHADQTISAVQADGALGQALNVEPLAALLRISRTSYDADGRPFLLTIAHYRADRFHIRIDLQGSRYELDQPPPGSAA